MTLLEKLQELLNNQASAEDIQSALGEYMIPKGTFNKVNEENKQLKTQISTLELEKSDLNEQLEELKTANMNEQELLQHRLEKAEAQIKQHAVEKNRLAAENKFVGAGFEKEEYLPLLEQLVSEDTEKTLNLVDGFLQLANKKAEETKKAFKDELLEGNSDLPKGDADNGSNEIDLNTFKNMGVKERTQLFNENKELYETLSKQEKGF